MLVGGFVAGVAYVAFPVSCLVTLEVVERLRAARRQWPAIAVMRVKAIVHVAVKAVVAVEPWTSSNEDAADKPVGPIVAVGRAVIGGIVEVPIGATGFNANTDGDFPWIIVSPCEA
jgi:hypothetical protein